MNISDPIVSSDALSRKSPHAGVVTLFAVRSEQVGAVTAGHVASTGWTSQQGSNFERLLPGKKAKVIGRYLSVAPKDFDDLSNVDAGFVGLDDKNVTNSVALTGATIRFETFIKPKDCIGQKASELFLLSGSRKIKEAKIMENIGVYDIDYGSLGTKYFTGTLIGHRKPSGAGLLTKGEIRALLYLPATQSQSREQKPWLLQATLLVAVGNEVKNAIAVVAEIEKSLDELGVSLL